jgi:hypothetical protein
VCRKSLALRWALYSCVQIVGGLHNYFDQGLRQLLLYQQEVQQYDQVGGLEVRHHT